MKFNDIVKDTPKWLGKQERTKDDGENRKKGFFVLILVFRYI